MSGPQAPERPHGRAFPEVDGVESRRRIKVERDMGVGVHQSRHHPSVREVDDFGAGRDFHLRPDLDDLAVLDQDDLAFRNRARGGIDEVPSADGSRLSQQRGDEKNGCKNNGQNKTSEPYETLVIHAPSKKPGLGKSVS